MAPNSPGGYAGKGFGLYHHGEMRFTRSVVPGVAVMVG